MLCFTIELDQYIFKYDYILYIYRVNICIYPFLLHEFNIQSQQDRWERTKYGGNVMLMK